MLNNRTRQNNRKTVQTRSISTRKTQNLFRTDNPFLFNCEFSNFNVGSIASIPNLTYSCATSGRTVQINENAVISGIAANYLPIGKVLNSQSNCLSLDAPNNNLINGSPGGTGWTNTVTVGDNIGVDDQISTKYIDDNSASATSTSRNFRSALVQNTTYYTSCWVNRYSGNTNFFTLRAQTPSFTDLILDQTKMSVKFQRFQGSIIASGGNYAISSIYPGSGLSSNVSKNGVWGWQFTSNKILTEYYDGNLTGANLYLTPENSISNSQINLELEFFPRNQSVDYGTVYVWYQDANNYCSYDGSTSKFTIKINGNSFTTTETYSWTSPIYTSNLLTQVRRIRLFIKCGQNINTQIFMKIDNNSNIISNSNSSQGPISNSNVYIMSSNDVNFGTFASHIKLIRLCPKDYLPDWCR